MANDIKLSDETVDVQGDATAALFNNGYLKLYSGTKPATANTAIGAQTLLATLRFAATGIATSVNGVLTANALTPDSAAAATGTASFFRAFKSDGTTVIVDGTVGSNATGDSASLPADLVMNNRNIQQNAQVSVSSFVHNIPK